MESQSFLGHNIANVKHPLHAPLYCLIHHQKTACIRRVGCEWSVRGPGHVSMYLYHSRMVLLTGDVVDDVAGLLVARAGYPHFGEVLYA